MKPLLMLLLSVLCCKGNHSGIPTAVKSILCHECLQTDSSKCEGKKTCNSTSGFCHLIVYEAQNDDMYIRQSCAADCGFPTSLFFDSKNYFSLCCAFDFCNNLRYSQEIILSHTNMPVSGFTASLFWANFRIILQYIGLED